MSQILTGGEKIPFNSNVRAFYDLRSNSDTLDVPHSHTKDGALVDCTIEFTKCITNPVKAAYSVTNIDKELPLIIRTTVHDVLAQASALEILGERAQLADKILEALNSRMKENGVEFSSVSLQKLCLPASYEDIFLQKTRLTMLIDAVSQRKHSETEYQAYATRRAAESVSAGVSLLMNLVHNDDQALSVLEKVVQVEKARTIATIAQMKAISQLKTQAGNGSLQEIVGKSEFDDLEASFEQNMKNSLTYLIEKDERYQNIPLELAFALDVATGRPIYIESPDKDVEGEGDGKSMPDERMNVKLTPEQAEAFMEFAKQSGLSVLDDGRVVVTNPDPSMKPK